MGACSSHDRKELVIVFMGLDNAGKTTIFNDLSGNFHQKTVASWGLKSKKLPFNNIFSITLNDLGGSNTIRGYWSNYLPDMHGWIFVIDAADKDRLSEAQSCFSELIKQQQVPGKPLVILANKQDLPDAMSSSEIAESLKLDLLPNTPYHIASCTALVPDDQNHADEAIINAFRWICDSIIDRYDDLETRRGYDMEKQKEDEIRERAARRQELDALRNERENAT